MAAVGRESRFMPMVKCSTCGEQVEISLMGEHTCGSSSSAPEPPPPLPAPSLLGRLMTNMPSMPSFGNPLAPKQQPRTTPPQVDTSAANEAFVNQGQDTPDSSSSGSQNSVSPLTPKGGPGAGDGDDMAPRIANNSPPPPPRSSASPGGYGGLGDDDSLPTNPPTKPGLSLKDRMEAMSNISSPFDPVRRPSAASRSGSIDGNDRPGTSSSSISSSSSNFGAPKMPKPRSGYGGFAPPPRPSVDMDEPPATPNRSETFPRPSDRFAPPQRTPSAPSRADNLQPPKDFQGPPAERPPLGSETPRRPSTRGGPSSERGPMNEAPRRPSTRGGPDTSRPPPPRGPSMIRPATPGVPVINLAEEFGIGNPYHTPSESTSSNNSSNNSDNSGGPERRPSQASQASSRTSPPRSLSSRSGKEPSYENLNNLKSPADEFPKPPKSARVPPLKIVPRDKIGRPPPPGARPPRERGYDPRIDPLLKAPDERARSPIPTTPITPKSPMTFVPYRPPALSPSATEPLPSPRWARSPERTEEQRQPPQPEPPAPQPQNQQEQQEQQEQPRQPPPEPEEPARPPTHMRSKSQPRMPGAPPNRGFCRACGEAITGKSVSSADGRLTGRYHKACFVCTTCKEPFPTATFYVLDDRPYCELHYHKLNGSLCGSCGRGIEGQYLEDTSSGVKHHVGCFKCGQCGMALRDGYYELNGKAYCEKDAFRLASGGGNSQVGPPGAPGSPSSIPGPLRPPYMNGLPGGPRPGMGGGYNRSPLGPGGRPPAMTKRMTRLGMMM
ncbi:hypothetical protein VTJ04DRAFT_10068 [Mycothermus thermophilus]|uniref:uncharacterized protein n=1 Tax=Humicola insolens TaxID=85995 RepID=UPI0037436EB6